MTDKMTSMTMKRESLIEIIKKNRDEHRDTFLEAQKSYREEVIAALDKMLSDARMGNKIKRQITLPEPEDHTKEYDAIILMLEMCVSDTIEVDSHEFQQYVMDEWGWKRNWIENTASYAIK